MSICYFAGRHQRQPFLSIQNKVGFCQGPSSVIHLCFDVSLQSQTPAPFPLSSSPTANGLRNHQPLSSPLAPLLPGLAKEGPM